MNLTRSEKAVLQTVLDTVSLPQKALVEGVLEPMQIVAAPNNLQLLVVSRNEDVSVEIYPVMAILRANIEPTDTVASSSCEMFDYLVDYGGSLVPARASLMPKENVIALQPIVAEPSRADELAALLEQKASDELKCSIDKFVEMCVDEVQTVPTEMTAGSLNDD